MEGIPHNSELDQTQEGSLRSQKLCSPPSGFCRWGMRVSSMVHHCLGCLFGPLMTRGGAGSLSSLFFACQPNRPPWVDLSQPCVLLHLEGVALPLRIPPLRGVQGGNGAAGLDELELRLREGLGAEDAVLSGAVFAVQEGRQPLKQVYRSLYLLLSSFSHLFFFRMRWKGNSVKTDTAWPEG